MSIQLRRAHPKVKGHAGKVALTRGPLVYCLESVDNQLDLFPVTVKRDSLRPAWDESLLGGIWKITRHDGRRQRSDLYSLHAVGQPRRIVR